MLQKLEREDTFAMYFPNGMDNPSVMRNIAIIPNISVFILLNFLCVRGEMLDV